MAVFTPVTLEEISAWAEKFPIGKVISVSGISSGIENSNFFVSAEHGEYVLTIFEKLSADQLPFYLQLMLHLAVRGVLVPEPLVDRDGNLISTLHGKPASLVSRLNGSHQMAPQPVHCAAVGAMLAKMHLAARDFPLHQPNLRGLDWWNETTPVVLPFLAEQEQHLLWAEMHFQETFAATPVYRQLPRGVIHADLFRNNVMFDGDQLTGFFDFYFAGTDCWLFDVAVTVNDWCIDLDTGRFDVARLNTLLEAYSEVRPFTPDEHHAWQPMLRAAALRFWLSRLYDLHLPRDAAMLTPHDPSHFEKILRERIDHAAAHLP